MENNVLTDHQKSSSKPLGTCPTTASTEPESKQVRFIYAAIKAQKVSVAGSFNNWTPGVFNLKKDLVGLWRGSINLKPGTYQYRYNADGKWIDDPNARNTVPNEFGGRNTVLVVK